MHQVERRSQEGQRASLVSSTEGDGDHVQQGGDAQANLATGDAHQDVDTQADVRRQGKAARVQEQGGDSGEGSGGL